MIPVVIYKIIGNHDLDDLKISCHNLGITLIKEDKLYNIFKIESDNDKKTKLSKSSVRVKIMEESGVLNICLYFIASNYNSLRTSPINKVTQEDGCLKVKTKNSEYIMEEVN